MYSWTYSFDFGNIMVVMYLLPGGLLRYISDGDVRMRRNC